MTYRPEINIDVLQWARDRARVKESDLEDRFPLYHKWMQGEKYPTMNQLEQLSKKLRVPLGYFFLDTPPEEPLPIPDYRTKKNRRVKRASPDLLESVLMMQRRQEWMQDFLRQEKADPIDFIGSVDLDATPEEGAVRMREALSLSEEWAMSHPNWREALRFLRNRMEENRVIVVINGVVGNNTHRKLDPNEFRGFVLSDKMAPLIFVNGADAKAAQMFSLAHEFAHLLLGVDALFDLNELQPLSEDVEVFCNKVAAEFLVPSVLIERQWEEAQSRSNAYEWIARKCKVSELVVARRALDRSLVSKTEFFRFYNNYREQHIRQKEEAKSSRSGDFYNTQNTRIGKPFANAIYQAVKEGSLLYRDAYKLTGLSSRTFDEYARRIGHR